MTPVTVIEGDGPIVLAQPHSGTFVPEEIAAQLNDLGREVRDTDWHIPELYDGLLPGTTIVRANFNRYVIDANRDPAGTSLYPGQNTTGLVPVKTFDDEPIWQVAPKECDVAERLKSFHAPYHEALRNQLDRVKSIHGQVLLYDCHSIRSNVPYLFEGQLPDLNIGTFDGQSCDPAFAEIVMAACEQQSQFSHVLNGRFKGGWTTRHYGRPDQQVHAVQMEIAQCNYLATEEPPFSYDPPRADALRAVLSNILSSLSNALETNS